MNSKPPRQPFGFTLLELLVVVAVIAILAALLLPVLSGAKGRGLRVACSNNLRQTFLALNMYSDEHSDQLPGPAWQGYYPMYDQYSSLFLAYYIPTYLGLPAPSASVVGVKTGVCPASAQLTKFSIDGKLTTSLQQPLSYILSISVTNILDDVVERPFGYPFASLPNGGGLTNYPPRRLKEILYPSRCWAAQDADQLNAVSLAQYYVYIPTTPSHVKVRNQLFFDGHVDAVKP
jgi:prepilin-type N-terminal cleavage/methylation domain-containing protein/prepilin-type processing-associated H-X9-DG protein